LGDGGRGWYGAGDQDGVVAVCGVEVAAVEKADCVGSGEATEELDEADFVVDFEIWSRHCGAGSIARVGMVIEAILRMANASTVGREVM
jgi:hypothetical protein